MHGWNSTDVDGRVLRILMDLLLKDFMLLVSVPVSLFTVPIVLDVTLFLIQWFSVEEPESLL